jgi:hypothetical protein
LALAFCGQLGEENRSDDDESTDSASEEVVTELGRWQGQLRRLLIEKLEDEAE